MKINVNLQCKNAKIETDECTVEKVITITDRDYNYFCNHLMEDYSFINENADLQYVDTAGTAHCIMVLGETSDDGVLVNSEGTSYARYSASVPNARQILSSQKPKDQSNDYKEKINQLIQDMCNNGGQGYLDMQFMRSIFPQAINSVDLMHFVRLVGDDPRIAEFRLEPDGQIFIQVDQEALSKSEERHFFTQEEVDIMSAKHMLWIYDEGGKRADFSNGNLVGLNLDNKNLNNALFNNSMINGCTFKEAGLCFAEFKDASISNSYFESADAEEATFNHATIENCFFQNASLVHADLSGSKIKSTNFLKSNLQNVYDDAIQTDDITEHFLSHNQSHESEEFSNENSSPYLSMK